MHQQGGPVARQVEIEPVQRGMGRMPARHEKIAWEIRPCSPAFPTQEADLGGRDQGVLQAQRRRLVDAPPVDRFAKERWIGKVGVARPIAQDEVLQSHGDRRLDPAERGRCIEHRDLAWRERNVRGERPRQRVTIEIPEQNVEPLLQRPGDCGVEGVAYHAGALLRDETGDQAFGVVPRIDDLEQPRVARQVLVRRRSRPPEPRMPERRFEAEFTCPPQEVLGKVAREQRLEWIERYGLARDRLATIGEAEHDAVGAGERVEIDLETVEPGSATCVLDILSKEAGIDDDALAVAALRFDGQALPRILRIPAPAFYARTFDTIDVSDPAMGNLLMNLCGGVFQFGWLRAIVLLASPERHPKIRASCLGRGSSRWRGSHQAGRRRSGFFCRTASRPT